MPFSSAIPAWKEDKLDSPQPPVPAAPYFDRALDAWVVSRYSDVVAALRSPSLIPAGPHGRAGSDVPEDPHRTNIREDTLAAFSPIQLNIWREKLTQQTKALASILPFDTPLDLLTSYAVPICSLFAATVTAIDPREAAELAQYAQLVSAAAADPYDERLRPAAKSANAELSRHFDSGPDLLRDSRFVALSGTLVCILGNAWLALLQSPDQWSLLHGDPNLMPQAIEELLRYAGLVRILFRFANDDVALDGVDLRKGQRVILRIFAANRDPERFPDPNRLDINRRVTGQIALGAGPHSCVGANLIRMGAAAITRPLLQRAGVATLTQPVTWRGGAIFRSPSSLWVSLKGG